MFPLHYTASLISQYWDATGYNGIYTHVGGIEAEPVMLDQTINMVLPKLVVKRPQLVSLQLMTQLR